MSSYKRTNYEEIIERAAGPRNFLQVLSGPRQVGKTTLAQQAKEGLSFPCHYVSADDPTLRDVSWIEQQWEIGRYRTTQDSNSHEALLILDEIQKIPHWADMVKKLWDQDTLKGLALKVMLLGSSTLLIQAGLAENLAGRFEVLPVRHWSYAECSDAFDVSLEEYIYFGGYPGAMPLIKQPQRWRRYIIDSIIETSLSRDVLLTTRIHKPILMRRLLELACHASGSIFSFQQIIGQLQDSGNSHTVAQYLHLLSEVGMATGLNKISSKPASKPSSPKLQVYNTALISASNTYSLEAAQENREYWDALVQSSVGAHLLNATMGSSIKILYWKEGNNEVDFVIQQGDEILTIELESSFKKYNTGFDAFSQEFKPKRRFLIGETGIPLQEFLLTPVDSLF
ncbi:MAG: ATP-binding protein [Alphaproteobacteria bacterium]|nr:ATP-binding protein [Alphaproteobacteria bacterium]